MKRSKLFLMLLVVVPMVGCTQYKKLTGQDTHTDSVETGPFLIAEVGMLPVSNTLTFSPAFDSSETLLTVKVRMSGVETEISSTVSGGTYYSFDGTTLTIYNYNAAANLGGNSDNFHLYYRSPYRAGYHSVS